MRQLKLSMNERIHITTALLVTSLVTLDKSQVGSLRRLARKVMNSASSAEGAGREEG